MPGAILGRKIGMTQIFNAAGDAVPVTVVEAGPCPVVQVKTAAKDGYGAVQLGFGARRKNLFTRPLAGHFARHKVEPTHLLREVSLRPDEKIEPGQAVTVELFQVGETVNVIGVSRGHGFQGTVKRHHFKGGPKTHGQSDRWRAPGSIGASSFPSRVLKNVRMAGRMGGNRVTVRNLSVVGVDAERHLLLISGSVPGKPRGWLLVSKVPKR